MPSKKAAVSKVIDAVDRCSFCKKSQDVVEVLIKSPKEYEGPPSFICDECICGEALEIVKQVKAKRKKEQKRIAKLSAA